MKPVCVPCRRFFRPKKNGYYFVEGMPIGDTRPQPGTTEPEKWKPYKLWSADLWKCRGCGAEILSGFANQPTAESYQPDFNSQVESLGANQLQVNDC